ncbi:MAG: GDSL-type esterase/lipase family protein [Abditibacteriaceae bacterium]
MNNPDFTIAAFGDSITQAVEVSEEKRWPALLATALQVRVVNCGVGGNTSREGLARIDGVLACAPNLVLIEFGGNDTTDEMHRYVDLEEFAHNLDQMLSTFLNADAEIALLTFPPVVEEWSSHNEKAWNQQHGGIDRHVELYRQATRHFAQTHQLMLIDIDSALRDAGKRSGWNKLFQPDGVHLTETGNSVVCETVYLKLQQMSSLATAEG